MSDSNDDDTQPSSRSPDDPSSQPSSEQTTDEPPSSEQTTDEPPSSEQTTDEPPSGGSEPGSTSIAAHADVDESELGVEHDLDGRVRVQWLVGPAFAGVIAGVISGGLAYLERGDWDVVTVDTTTAIAIGVAVFAAIVLLGAIRAVLLYRSWSYEVREDSLYLSRGVFTRTRTVAPYVRVQHIDTQRSPVERTLGLSTLVVYTAGTRGADVTVPGLGPDRATELQRRLKRLAIESEEDDAV